MKTIKINLYTPRELWFKWMDRLDNEAQLKTEANWTRVTNVKKEIIHHIKREPIQEENKEYLINAVESEFAKLRLHSVWPIIKKRK